MGGEGRQVVAAGIRAIEGMPGETAAPASDRGQRAREQRERFARVFVPVPEAIDREIAGVRCRIFVPDREVNGVYLDFHGGGMIIGAPELHDLANPDLCPPFALAGVSVDYRLPP